MLHKCQNFCRFSHRMPKPNKKSNAASSNKKEQVQLKLEEAGPLSINKTGQILLKVLAKPGAKQDSITDISSEGVGIQINAPPIDGEANTHLIKYLSQILSLPKSAISLERGSKSRQKTISISDSSMKIEDILKKLELEKNNS